MMSVDHDRRTSDSRLERIEAKVDALTHAMTNLVAVEVHIKHLNERFDRQEARIDKLDSELVKLDDRVRSGAASTAGYEGGIKMFERIMLIVLSASATFVLTLVFSTEGL